MGKIFDLFVLPNTGADKNLWTKTLTLPLVLALEETGLMSLGNCHMDAVVNLVQMQVLVKVGFILNDASAMSQAETIDAVSRIVEIAISEEEVTKLCSCFRKVTPLPQQIKDGAGSNKSARHSAFQSPQSSQSGSNPFRSTGNGGGGGGKAEGGMAAAVAETTVEAMAVVAVAVEEQAVRLTSPAPLETSSHHAMAVVASPLQAIAYSSSCIISNARDIKIPA